MDLTDHQWNFLQEFMPAGELTRGPGRPWADARRTLNGVLWILRTGAQWSDLPTRYGAPSTVHRRFQHWRKEGVFRQVLEVLADHLHREGRLDLSECFIDGTFAPAKRGALMSVKPSGAKEPRSWEWQTLMALQSASAWSALRPRK
jgi:transposase